MADVAETFNINTLSLPYRLSFYCAPVLLGVKSGNTITIENQEISFLSLNIDTAEIKHHILFQDENKSVLFLYRPQLVENKLREGAVLRFLTCLGYRNFTLRNILQRLTVRYEEYMESGGEFPHELGIFLDYPLDDVLCFIRYGGQDCKKCGYWKVYTNLEEAEEKFQLYDKARCCLMQYVMEGKKMRDIRLTQLI